ncbi:DUF5615 family PIN-like protein [Chloroflexi bacterium TSY]|nr:DUF5615 family PIN-like protein [Chloroflexi bacterium TSY]
MHILADENCPQDLVNALRARGHDVSWIRTDSPGVKDPEILARAQDEERIVLTFDKDFGELAFRYKLPAQSGIILCRLHGLPPTQLVQLVLHALDSQPSWNGLFAVITEERVRIIPLP